MPLMIDDTRDSSAEPDLPRVVRFARRPLVEARSTYNGFTPALQRVALMPSSGSFTPMDGSCDRLGLWSHYVGDIEGAAIALWGRGYDFILTGRHMLSTSALERGEVLVLLLVVTKDGTPIDPFQDPHVLSVMHKPSDYEHESNEILTRQDRWSYEARSGPAALYVYAPMIANIAVEISLADSDLWDELFPESHADVAPAMSIDPRYPQASSLSLLQKAYRSAGGRLNFRAGDSAMRVQNTEPASPSQRRGPDAGGAYHPAHCLTTPELGSRCNFLWDAILHSKQRALELQRHDIKFFLIGDDILGAEYADRAGALSFLLTVTCNNAPLNPFARPDIISDAIVGPGGSADSFLYTSENVRTKHMRWRHGDRDLRAYVSIYSPCFREIRRAVREGFNVSVAGNTIYTCDLAPGAPGDFTYVAALDEGSEHCTRVTVLSAAPPSGTPVVAMKVGRYTYYTELRPGPEASTMHIGNQAHPSPSGDESSRYIPDYTGPALPERPPGKRYDRMWQDYVWDPIAALRLKEEHDFRFFLLGDDIARAQAPERASLILVTTLAGRVIDPLEHSPDLSYAVAPQTLEPRESVGNRIRAFEDRDENGSRNVYIYCPPQEETEVLACSEAQAIGLLPSHRSDYTGILELRELEGRSALYRVVVTRSSSAAAVLCDNVVLGAHALKCETALRQPCCTQYLAMHFHSSRASASGAQRAANAAMPYSSLWRYYLRDVGAAAELTRHGFRFLMLGGDLFDSSELSHGVRSGVKHLVVAPESSVDAYSLTDFNVYTRSEEWNCGGASGYMDVHMYRPATEHDTIVMDAGEYSSDFLPTCSDNASLALELSDSGVGYTDMVEPHNSGAAKGTKGAMSVTLICHACRRSMTFMSEHVIEPTEYFLGLTREGDVKVNHAEMVRCSMCTAFLGSTGDGAEIQTEECMDLYIDKIQDISNCIGHLSLQGKKGTAHESVFLVKDASTYALEMGEHATCGTWDNGVMCNGSRGRTMETRTEYVVPVDLWTAPEALFGFYLKDLAEAHRMFSCDYRFVILGESIFSAINGGSLSDASLLLIVLRNGIPIDPLADLGGFVTSRSEYATLSSSMSARTVRWLRGEDRGEVYLHVYRPRTANGVIFLDSGDTAGFVAGGEGKAASSVLELDARYAGGARRDPGCLCRWRVLLCLAAALAALKTPRAWQQAGAQDLVYACARTVTMTAAIWEWYLSDVGSASRLVGEGYEFFVLYSFARDSDTGAPLAMLFVATKGGVPVDPLAADSDVRDIIAHREGYGAPLHGVAVAEDGCKQGRKACIYRPRLSRRSVALRTGDAAAGTPSFPVSSFLGAARLSKSDPSSFAPCRVEESVCQCVLLVFKKLYTQQQGVARRTANMGNTESRVGAPEIRRCITSIEEELLVGEYDSGVTPESVVMCLRAMLMAVEKEGGNVVVPKAVGVHYERDVVVSCFPRTRSRYSASVASSGTGMVRSKRGSVSGSTVSEAVETPMHQRPGLTASEARKIRMAKRAESRRRGQVNRHMDSDSGVEPPAARRRDTSTARRSDAGGNARAEDTPAYYTATGEDYLTDATLEQISALNIHKLPQDIPTPRNDPAVFRGPPAQRTRRLGICDVASPLNASGAAIRLHHGDPGGIEEILSHAYAVIEITAPYEGQTVINAKLERSNTELSAEGSRNTPHALPQVLHELIALQDVYRGHSRYSKLLGAFVKRLYYRYKGHGICMNFPRSCAACELLAFLLIRLHQNVCYIASGLEVIHRLPIARAQVKHDAAAALRIPRRLQQLARELLAPRYSYPSLDIPWILYPSKGARYDIPACCGTVGLRFVRPPKYLSHLDIPSAHACGKSYLEYIAVSKLRRIRRP
ncbi:hypothetical protein ETB97_009806 [Aspergillus alliaceus]|uniref:Uncharacterized protein n=1 Tax=Petromyces alliaceus TaxID=209559 RepID=A0A8H6AAC8_PETAA|nr:hypothetical protein ETB97_009806 [Aspergillus burnettii]